MMLFGAAPFLDFPDPGHLGRDAVRLVVAAGLGALIGVERQQEGKAAGLRTHMLVALGAALFILIPGEAVTDSPPSGESLSALSRAVQGIVTGIGFLGAGTILKLSDQREIKGLTTAASIWLTAAIGMAVGVGWLWPALLATALALLALFAAHPVETWIKRTFPPRAPRD